MTGAVLFRPVARSEICQDDPGYGGFLHCQRKQLVRGESAAKRATFGVLSSSFPTRLRPEFSAHALGREVDCRDLEMHVPLLSRHCLVC